MIVLALDPGKTTGYSVFKYNDTHSQFLEAGEFSGWSLIKPLLDKYHPDVVLYEQFHLVSISIDKTPIEVIGVIKYICSQELLIPRTPEARKFAVMRYKDTSFKHIRSIHGRAATHHAVAWLYHDKHIRNFTFVPKS